MAGGNVRKSIAALLLAPLLAATAAGTPASAAMTLPTTGTSALAAFASHAFSPLFDIDGIGRRAVAATDQLPMMLANSSDRFGSAISEAEPAGRPAIAKSVPTSTDRQTATWTGITGSSSFGTVAIPFKRLSAVKKLAPALEEMRAGRSLACNTGCTDATRAVAAVVRSSDGASLRDKLNRVNAAVNGAIRYRPDIEAYNVSDRWATPAETLSRQEGDCEDYAILKMAALQAGGVDAKDMAIVVLFDQKRRFYHAVLSVRVGSRHLILDNMHNEVMADTQLQDYLPLYSIADGKGYLHGTVSGQQKLASAIPLDRVAPGEGAVAQ